MTPPPSITHGEAEDVGFALRRELIARGLVVRDTTGADAMAWADIVQWVLHRARAVAADRADDAAGAGE